VSSDPLLIYGATGYSGRLMTEAAMRANLRPILGGRNAEKVMSLSDTLGLEGRVARLEDPRELAVALRGIAVVLHAAGPFSRTARPMVDACLRAGVHYLDLSAAADVVEELVARDAEARQQRIMIMPGVGFDLVPTDCLAAHIARRLPGAEHLAIGIRGLVLATRGSAKAFAEYAGRDIAVRRCGAITSVPAGTLERPFDYGQGMRPSSAVSWGDVAAAYYTTGIPNIEVYFESTALIRSMVATTRYFGPFLRTAPWQAVLKTWADTLPAGPTPEQRAKVETVVVAEGEDGSGKRVRARLRAPEAYTLTAETGPAIGARVLAGDLEIGFQTPGRVYGADFVLRFAGVTREDLE
jgi:short subunit dehydrogenase-like uncharacterized protein